MGAPASWAEPRVVRLGGSRRTAAVRAGHGAPESEAPSGRRPGAPPWASRSGELAMLLPTAGRSSRSPPGLPPRSRRKEPDADSPLLKKPGRVTPRGHHPSSPMTDCAGQPMGSAVVAGSAADDICRGAPAKIATDRRPIPVGQVPVASAQALWASLVGQPRLASLLRDPRDGANVILPAGVAAAPRRRAPPRERFRQSRSARPGRPPDRGPRARRGGGTGDPASRYSVGRVLGGGYGPSPPSSRCLFAVGERDLFTVV